MRGDISKKNRAGEDIEEGRIKKGRRQKKKEKTKKKKENSKKKGEIKGVE